MPGRRRGITSRRVKLHVKTSASAEVFFGRNFDKIDFMTVSVNLLGEMVICLTIYGNENRCQMVNKGFCLFFELGGVRVKAWN
ncbi:hypothetical protein CT690_06825 [Serratia plymuthica]|uniref:Uncharacterized protein n=1 Tax=Serratia plymuthica TaxID=82996 RepID=A0A318P7B6_SERPL|nr:hypothetical protein CT690_06825 [Serratia plymuthica]